MVATLTNQLWQKALPLREARQRTASTYDDTPSTHYPMTKKPGPPQTEAESKAGFFVQERLNECQTAMMSLHRKWVINKALRLGHQYHIWSDQNLRLRSVQAPSYRERHITNVVDPVVRTYVAQLLQNPVQFQVVPAKTDPEAMMKASNANKLLEYHFHECSWDRLQQVVANWMFEVGCGWVKVIWDPAKGPLEEAVDRHGEPMKWAAGPLAGIPMTDPKTGHPLTYPVGSVVYETPSPFQMFVDPLFVGPIDDAPYIIQRTMHPLDWFQEQYPEKGKYVTPENIHGHGQSVERQFMAIAYGDGRSFLAAGDSNTDYAYHTELWLRPTKEHPKGRHICMGNEVVLKDTDCRYLYARGARPDRDWHPYVMFECSPIPGRFWPQDVVGNAHGIQKAINRLVSDALEVSKMTGKPKWAIPIGSMERSKRITTETGENLWYNSTYGPPHMLPPGHLSPDTINLINIMFEHLDFVSMQHGPSRGQAPSGVKSGIGLNLLQEQDMRDMNPIAKLWEASNAALGRKTLMRCAQEWSTRRKVRIMSNNNRMDAFEFTGADLSSSFDVFVKAGSSLPKSKAATMAWYKDLVNMGVFLPAMNPQHRRQLIEDLEVGTVEQRIEGERQHRRRAQWENILLKKGILPNVEWFQDADVHLEEHLSYMNSDDYLMTVNENPQVEVFFNMHIALHVQPMNQWASQEQGQLGMPPGPQQVGARQGSVPQGQGNPQMNLQGLPSMPGGQSPQPQAGPQSGTQ